MSLLVTLKKKWEKSTQGTRGYIIYIILGFILAYSFNVGLGYALSTDTPVVAVFSNSMVPEFYKGDMAVVEGVSDIRLGDIIVFDVPSRSVPIIHRIISIQDGEIRTKGDNNPSIDPWITSKENVHGKVLFIIPGLGWVKIICAEAGIPICTVNVR